jgi:WhiB family redox-sensing transcriptional regulator
MGMTVDDFNDEHWYKYGACRGLDVNLFFPEIGVSRIQMTNVKAVCARCVVASSCLDYAVSQSDDPEGIWGGTSPRERRELRRKYKQRTA